MGNSPPSKKVLNLLPLTIVLLVMALPLTASAAGWRKLDRSEQHEVALDEDSVRQSATGSVTLLLKYTPLGKTQRKRAATGYGRKDYHQHLEHYVIDCKERMALLESTDIMGISGKRVGRLKGGGQAQTIKPGSLIDKAAEWVCPVLVENSPEEEDKEETVNAQMPMTYSDNTIEIKAQQHINDTKLLLEADPSNHGAWVELGNAYYDSGMHDQAIEAYNHALVLKPDDSDVLNDQGAMYRQSGNITQALKNFERAFAIAPSNLESLYNLGYIYAFDLNHIDKALEIWQRYLKFDQSSETSRQVQSFIERYSH